MMRFYTTALIAVLAIATSLHSAAAQVVVSQSQAESVPLPGAVYQHDPIVLDLGGDGQIQLQSMSAPLDPGHVTVLKVFDDPPGNDYTVDSFFDIAYQIGPSGGPYTVDSFFDIAYRIDVTSEDLADGRRCICKRIDASTPLLLMTVPGTGDQTIIEASLEEFEHTLSPLPSGDYQVDSFFDIAYRISLDGGSSFSDPTAPVRATMISVVPEPASCLMAVLPEWRCCRFAVVERNGTRDKNTRWSTT